MKKAVVCAIFACLFPAIAYSQNALAIDAALSNSTSYFSGRIPANTKVVVLNFSSKWADLSDYIIEELISYIVNEGKLTVVDRQNLETIRREMDFQLSGEVSDETAQSIGRKLGAQTIISGSITAIGNLYRLRVRAISVETAQILGMQSVDVAQDSRIAALTGTAYTGPAVATTTAPRAVEANVNANTAQVAAAQPVSAQGTNEVISQTSGWKSGSAGSTVKVAKEQIGGRELDVLTVTGNKINEGAYLDNGNIIPIFKNAHGVRFKALGDGRSWIVFFVTSDVSDWGQSHRVTISTQKDRVVEIDIPYDKLRQPAEQYIKTTVFNKTNIICVGIQRVSRLEGSGPSTIKIFDFKIY
jgi:TolB-like protein